MTAGGPSGHGQHIKPGLYVMATPLGNLRDITLRALDILEVADTVYCEDTRVTKRLAAVFGFRAALQRCDEHTQKKCIGQIIDDVRAGKIIVLVSDAGTPAISDPGAQVVAACWQAGITVYPVPGPNAVTAALSASGLLEDGSAFTFLGFLPPKSGARRAILKKWQDMPTVLVLYEAPQRVAALLEDIAATLGDCPVVIGRELTKLHERFYHGTPQSLHDAVRAEDFKGEIVVMVSPKPGQGMDWTPDRIRQALQKELGTVRLKEAVARVTARSGLPRKQIYAEALSLNESGEKPGQS